MKNFLKLLCLLGLAAPAGVLAQVTIQNTTYAAGQNVTVANSSIAANTNVVVASGAVVKYRGTSSITLGPGFTASSGSAFRAFIFVDGNSNGMDDAWEATYGVSDPAGNPDGDSLTNLQEYLLGTNPLVTNSADTSNTNALKVHRPQ